MITKALFRDLSEVEILEFRQWARDNYKPEDEINTLWHSVVQDECADMIIETQNRIRTITPKMIDGCLEGCNHQMEVWEKLYRIALPMFDEITHITNWPSVSEETYMYISRKFIEFDKVHHPEVLFGGLWMNSGFAIATRIADWRIDLNTCKIEMKHA